MGKSAKRKKPKRAPAVEAKNRLYDGLSKCLEDGHVSFAQFPVQGADGISKLHACSQCGLMYWEK